MKKCTQHHREKFVPEEKHQKNSTCHSRFRTLWAIFFCYRWREERIKCRERNNLQLSATDASRRAKSQRLWPMPSQSARVHRDNSGDYANHNTSNTSSAAFLSARILYLFGWTSLHAAVHYYKGARLLLLFDLALVITRRSLFAKNAIK